MSTAAPDAAPTRTLADLSDVQLLDAGMWALSEAPMGDAAVLSVVRAQIHHDPEFHSTDEHVVIAAGLYIVSENVRGLTTEERAMVRRALNVLGVEGGDILAAAAEIEASR